MSTQRTPPSSFTKTSTNNIPLTQDSDTASEAIYSENDQNTGHITRRCKRKHGDIANNEIKELLNDLKTQQNENFTKFVADMSTIKHQNAEMEKSLKFMSDKYDELLANLNKVQLENSSYRSKIQALENKIEQLERNSKSSSVEIRNIPIAQSEDKSTLTMYVKNMAEKLDQQIQDYEIRDIYRLKQKTDKPGPIIVEFTTVSRKESLVKSIITFNKSNVNDRLNTSHISIPGMSRPIYVSDSLTAKARRLHYLARELANKYKHGRCWTAYGKIFIRLNEDMKSIRIDSEDELNILRANN